MVFATTKLLAVLFLLLPAGTLAVRGETSSVPHTALPDCTVEELSVTTREVRGKYRNRNRNFGVNQLLSPIDAIELDEIAFIGAQKFVEREVVVNDGENIPFYVHCIGFDGETIYEEPSENQKTAEHTYDKPVCNLEICLPTQFADPDVDCIRMRYFSGSSDQFLSVGPPPYPPEDPEESGLIVGAVLGGTGQYSNVIGGEFRFEEFDLYPTSSADDIEDMEIEFKLIACSDEPASSSVPNDEQAPTKETIEEDFEIFITNVDVSIGYDRLRSDVAIERASTGIPTIIKTGTLGHSQDQNPSDDSNNFITFHCTALEAGRYDARASEQTCNIDLVYGNDEKGEPNSIFLKATGSFDDRLLFDTGGEIYVDKLAFDSQDDEGVTIDATVVGGRGKYRSAGGKARITLDESSGAGSGDGVIQTGTIHIELIPYYSGVNLWGDK